MADIAIDVREVTKKFVIDTHRSTSLKEALVRSSRTPPKDFWALKGVSLEVAKGSFFGLIGHNGSGKSTLLRLMGGIHKPTSGSVTTTGRISALLELGAGFHPDLTGRENIYLNGAMLGLSQHQMDQAVDDIVDFSGIGEFVDAPVKIYSSGMHVRLGFAISVHVDPEILIVDEVLAVGDEDFQRRCLDHIYSLRRNGVTIVLVSHSIAQMETLCDEIAWLDHGELVMHGTPTEVADKYLSRVNEQENERISEAAAQQAATIAPTEPDRAGSGEIRVSNVTFHNSDGSERHSAASGEPFTIRLHYDAVAEIDDPVFGIGIYHENGTHMAGPNQKLHGVRNGVLQPGSGTVDMTIGAMALLPGKYYVTSGIYSTNLMHCFDSWDRSHSLVVQPGSATERHGLVDLGVSWEPARPRD